MMAAYEKDRLHGAARWAEKLEDQLAEHLLNEGDVLTSYMRFAGQDLPALPRYLVNLVLEDEKRHHDVLGGISQQLHEMAASSDEETYLPRPAGSTVPAGLLEETEKFLSIEKADGRELRKLIKALRVRRDQDLWDLIMAFGDDDQVGSDQVEAWQRSAGPLDPELLAEARLWELLIRMQLLDTRKHQLILEFIRYWCRTEGDRPAPEVAGV